MIEKLSMSVSIGVSPSWSRCHSFLFAFKGGKKKERERKGIGRTVENGQWTIGNLLLFFFFYGLLFENFVARIFSVGNSGSSEQMMFERLNQRSLEWLYSMIDSVVNEWSVNGRLIVSLWLIKGRYVMVNNQLGIG